MTRLFTTLFLAILLTACSQKPVLTDLLQKDMDIHYDVNVLQRLYSRDIYVDPWIKKPYIVKMAYEVDREKKWSKTTRALVLPAQYNNPAEVAIPLTWTKGKLTFDCASMGKGRLMVQLLSHKKKMTLGEYTLSTVPFKTIAIAIEKNYSDAVLILNFQSDSEDYAYCFVANAMIKHTDNTTIPNVVFISVDALRADAVHCIVPEYAITPNMDALAKDGAAFVNHCVVANWTRPSTIAMLSSVYGSTTGVNIYYFQVSNQEKKYFYTQSGVVPLPILFKHHGYITRSIGNNAFILDHSGVGVDVGFDDMSEYERQWEDTVDIASEVEQWLADNKDKPFFLFVNFNAPHNAYIPPAQYLEPLRKSIKGVHPWFRRYLGEVAYTDDYIGRIIAVLKSLKLYDNTIIVVTTDHGEVFHEAHSHSPYTDKKSIFTHGQTLFDEEMHVPLIIKLPEKQFTTAVSVPYQVRNIDIAPTVCELAGIPIPQSYQGISLLPYIEGSIEGSEHGDRPVYCEGRLMYGVRADGYKYVEKFYGFGVKPYHWGGQQVSEYHELYDLQKDPDELYNIAGIDDEKVSAMKKKLYALRFKQPGNVLYAKKNVTGSIAVKEGFFYTVESEGVVQQANRQSCRFKLKKGQRLIFSTIPARTQYFITTDGVVVLLGYGGIALPKHGNEYIFDTTNPLLQQPIKSDAIAAFPDAIIAWCVPGKSGLQKVSESVTVSSQMNDLLKQWGYIQNDGTH